MGMDLFFEFLGGFGNTLSILRTVVLVIIIFVIANILIGSIRKNLLKRARTKIQKSNVEMFSRVLRYLLFLILLLFAIFSYAGSLEGLGMGLGLLSAAIGLALQRPISGVAGWLVLITKKPFVIGDRIIVGAVRGDVVDITLTHIYLQEIGGIVQGEENSGRIVMIPNAVLFEQNIINYTLRDEYVLDQVVVAVTYESNLDAAVKIALKAAKKHTSEFANNTKKEPYVRTFFQPSGLNVHVRYYSPAIRLQEISSDITREVYNRIMKANDVEIAYPHTEIILKEKSR